MYDITLALSFLHSNRIIHRDLSSNNVLLIDNIRAKLTDFGMARLGDLNLHTTQITKAVQDKPVYTEKIDCFSFGVITVQTLIQEFPKPGDRMKVFDDPWFPQGALKVCVPEIKRYTTAKPHQSSWPKPSSPTDCPQLSQRCWWWTPLSSAALWKSSSSERNS